MSLNTKIIAEDLILLVNIIITNDFSNTWSNEGCAYNMFENFRSNMYETDVWHE